MPNELGDSHFMRYRKTMSERDEATKKKRGRPATGLGQLIGVRLQPDALSQLDAYRDAEGDAPTRPEAIRRLVLEGLATHGFLKRGQAAEPTGPATEAVKAMEAAIRTDRKKKKTAAAR